MKTDFVDISARRRRRSIARSGFIVGLAMLATPVMAQGRGTRDYGPMVLGDWLFYPSVTAGGIYNDNVFSRSTNKVGSLGTTFSGSGFASRDDGLSKSRVYATGRADVYPDNSKGNSYTGTLGATYSREFGQDLMFDGTVEIARLQNSLRSQSQNLNGSLNLSSSDYTQFQTSVSLRKNFNRFYVEGGGSAITQVYDKSSAQTADKNGWSGTLRSRLGYEVSPAVSVYAEPSVNFQRYDNSFYDANVYRAVVGVSLPRLGLFSGDLNGGYMWGQYPSSTAKTEHAPTFGGSVSWLPTEDITVTLAAQQAFGLNGPGQNNAFSVLNSIPGAVAGGDPFAAAANGVTPAATANAQAVALANQLIAATAVNQQLFASSGSQTKSSTFSLGGRYLMNALTSTGLTLSYQATSRSGVTTSPTADVFMARLNVDYAIWANWGLSGTYSFARVLYDQPGLSYTQNVITFGVNGRL